MTIPHPARSGVVDAVVFNPLRLPGPKVYTEPFQFEAGQTLLPGSVLGIVTATGRLKLSAAAANDGSQVPVAILLEPISSFDPATGAAAVVSGPAATKGSFNQTALILGAGHSIASIKDGLRARGIHLRAPGYSG